MKLYSVLDLSFAVLRRFLKFNFRARMDFFLDKPPEEIHKVDYGIGQIF